MRISLNWIKRLLGVESLGLPTSELVRRLTLHLTEIDDVECTGPALDGVVVGRVTSCEPHPDADRLRVTTVDVGAEAPLPIVCGADNVAAGQLVPVATIGTTLTMTGADGTVQSMTVKKGKLRGVASHGMICAEDELGLSDDHSGIMVLDGDHPPGTPLNAVLDRSDEVLVIDNHNINHRPDLWGHLGWAREIAAILDLPAPSVPDPVWSDGGDGAPFKVAIEDEGGIAYCGAVVSGVANQPSPEWMRGLLEAAGVRPLGLLVDITNFVMLELGEPMHAFDRRSIRGDRILVRAAGDGETITTLDESELTLEPADLLIADDHGPLALAGIMGGQGSMVRDDTATIVLEAATFAPARIRRTRVRTGVSTESSSRFEKSLYPQLAALAIERAIDLLRECGAVVHVERRFSAGAGLRQLAEPAPVLPYDPPRLRHLTGFDLPQERQLALLAALGFQASGDGVTIPWWRRKDITGMHDLIEEVARLHGYEHVRSEVPALPAAAPQPNLLRRNEHRCRSVLSALGWDEVATYGFTSEAWADALGWPAASLIRLVHPLSSDQTVLRLSLLPNLAEAVGRNLRHLAAVQIYEIGKIYGRGLGQGDCADERLCLAAACCGDGDTPPFYAARDAACEVLAALGHPAAVAPLDTDDRELIAGRRAVLTIGDTAIGRVGEVVGDLRRHAGVDAALGYFHIELEQLCERCGQAEPVHFRPVSRYQQVDRDFTFVCPESLAYGEVAAIIRQTAKDLARDIDLAAPVYRGDQIPEGCKALSLRVWLQADDRTLSEKDLRKTSQRIITAVEKRTAARLRT